MKSTAYYDQNADAFFDGTINAELGQLRQRFLNHLPKQGRGHILDAGCGSGRDALAFAKAGYQVTAFDASVEMVKRASIHSSLPVLHMAFEDVNWNRQFDGIWACASLLHVPQASLIYIMQKLVAALRLEGVLYGSFKYGVGEIDRDGRRFTNQTEESLKKLITAVAGVQLVEEWLSEDVRPGRSEMWLNFVLRRTSQRSLNP